MNTVQVVRIARRLKKRHAPLVITGASALILIVSVAFVHYSSAPVLHDQVARDNLYAASPDVSHESAALPQHTASAGSQNASDMPATEVLPPADTPGVPTQTSCESIETKYREAYNHDAKKEKARLDSILSFPVGLSISSGYVEEFNASITAIFNKYAALVAAADCQFPVKHPPTLPLTYQP